MELCSTGPLGGPRREGLAGPRRETWHPRGAVPAEYALCSDILLRGATRRRRGGELQSALCGTRTGPRNPRFRYRNHGDDGPVRDVPQGGGGGGPNRAAPRCGLPDGGRAALAEGIAVPLCARTRPGCDRARRGDCLLRRIDAQRWPPGGGGRTPRRSRGAAIYWWHHGRSQGGRTDAFQYRQQLRAGDCRNGLAKLRPGTRARCIAAVPCVRADRGDGTFGAHGILDDPGAAIRFAGFAGHDRAHQTHDVSGGADDLYGPRGGRRQAKGGSGIHQTLHQRRRTAAGGNAAALYRIDRVRIDGRLRPERDQPRGGLHAARLPLQGWLGGAAGKGHCGGNS